MVVGSHDRGGTVLLVRNYSSEFVQNVDTNAGDQNWVEFGNIPRVMSGFCYIPPCDSQYYSHEFFAAIQERIREGDG